MAKDPRTPLRDIVESSDRIISNVGNVSIEEFEKILIANGVTPKKKEDIEHQPLA